MYYSENMSPATEIDLSEFFKGVEKFNKIANPEGVDIEKQIPIIESELQEILDSETAVEFVDGLCDSLFTLGPLLKTYDWRFLYNEATRYNYMSSLTHLTSSINSFRLNHDEYLYLKRRLVDVLHLDKNYYRYNLREVVNSNLSKFIPVSVELRDVIIPPELELVKNKYPDSDVSVTYTDFEGRTYAVFKDENGKVLKGHKHYFDPHIITDF